jgi:hypothetical protein
MDFYPLCGYCLYFRFLKIRVQLTQAHSTNRELDAGRLDRSCGRLVGASDGAWFAYSVGKEHHPSQRPTAE